MLLEEVNDLADPAVDISQALSIWGLVIVKSASPPLRQLAELRCGRFPLPVSPRDLLELFIDLLMRKGKSGE